MRPRQIGAYTVIAPLGAGGMGEVYRAHDSKLGRDVAIKILPTHFMLDAERQARLTREARVLATLNHPNIGAIYGLEQADGVTALVLELVEGVSLADRVTRGPLKPAQAIAIARQIADALAAAHEQGIIHRDLKPANVMLQGNTDISSAEVRVKVLDFGLAKPLTNRDAEDQTISGDRTEHGRVLGTPAYMSPEQARGQSVDGRTDVWAFGCVLYEMLTGRAAFRGATISDTIAKVLERDPEWELLPSSIPPGIRRLLARCLEKDPKRRMHAIADVHFELDDAVAGNVALSVPTRRSSRWWPWAATAVVAIAAAGGWWAWSSRGQVLPAPRVLPLTTYPGIESSPTFSPDGKQVAFSWDRGTGDAEDIYVVLVGADSPLQLTRHPAREVSPTWKPDGSQIAFARLDAGRAAIYVVSPLGGSERKLAEFDAVPTPSSGPIETSNPNLSWSPDGRWLAVSRVASATNPDVALVSEDGSIRSLIERKDGTECGVATFSPAGNALACINGNGGYIDIFALRETDPPEAILPARRVTPFLGFVSGLAWADGKTLVFGRAQFAAPDPPALWRVAVSGSVAPERIDLAGVAGYPAVSAAGSRIAFVRRDLNEDLFLLQEGRPPEPFQVSTFNEQDASFSPDGSKVAFSSDRNGESLEIWIALTSDATTRRSLTKGARKPEGTPRWSPDGRRIAFDGVGDDGLRHVYVVDEAGGPLHPVPGKAGSREQVPSWSRDGRWIYYESTRTGRSEIWRAPADGGEPQQMTTTGGDRAFESADGRTLYYRRAIDSASMLFERPLSGGPERPLGIRLTFWNYEPVKGGVYYMAAPQGQRPPFTYEVRFFDAVTRDSRLIYTLPMAAASPGLSVRADGKSVLIAGVMQYGQDLMRLENFSGIR